MSALYIRVRTGFYTHRKTAQLKLAIGDAAYWIPPRLWAYCAENQPDGDISDYSPELLASLLGYSSNAQAMLEALKQCGFVDAEGLVHDWEEHNGYHREFSVRAKKAATARWSKAAPNTEKESEEVQGKGDKHCSSIAPSILTTIYEAYPKRVGKPKALIAIKKAVAQFGDEFILQKTTEYASARAGEDPAFTPMPATWFNQERFNDDPATWKNGKFQKAPARCINNI